MYICTAQSTDYINSFIRINLHTVFPAVLDIELYARSYALIYWQISLTLLFLTCNNVNINQTLAHILYSELSTAYQYNPGQGVDRHDERSEDPEGVGQEDVEDKGQAVIHGVQIWRRKKKYHPKTLICKYNLIL